MLTVDLEGRIESWNPQLEELLGIPRSEAIGRKLDEVLPADLAAEIAARADERTRLRHLQIPPATRAAAGSSWSTFRSRRCSAKIGARLGRLILLDDITQRVRMEEQMVQNEKLTSLGLLAAGVAHEVNTPLAVISNYIQMLAKQLPADDPRQKTIDKSSSRRSAPAKSSTTC